MRADGKEFAGRSDNRIEFGIPFFKADSYFQVQAFTGSGSRVLVPCHECVFPIHPTFSSANKRTIRRMDSFPSRGIGVAEHHDRCFYKLHALVHSRDLAAAAGWWLTSAPA